MRRRDVIKRFVNRQRGYGGNYFTDGEKLTLFGNTIATWNKFGLWVTYAGWTTNTTAFAVNYILQQSGSDISMVRRKNKIVVYRHPPPEIDTRRIELKVIDNDDWFLALEK